MLLNAFTRALKDSFPPARVAGVKVGAESLSSLLQRLVTLPPKFPTQ